MSSPTAVELDVLGLERIATGAVPEAPALDEVCRSLARQILASTDLERSDRLWPADPSVFQTNALHLAHGACGTALYLHDVDGELPVEVRTWLTSQEVTVDSYPPGLYSGIAGVAWSLAELGMLERGRELMDLVPQSPLLLDAPDIYNGAAGWGMAALWFYLQSGEERFLHLACRAGDHLVESAEHEGDGSCWRQKIDDVIRLGFAFGGSGIGLFLLYLWKVTDVEPYLAEARRAIEFEIAHAKVDRDALVWGVSTGDAGHRPYWMRGGGGVTSALIRFHQTLGDERYLDHARRGARGAMAFFSAAPHLFEGLASMGETSLDMFQATGETLYLEAARAKARQCLLFSVEGPVGASFPGRYLMRIAHDLGVGGAGIGLFLHRLAHQRRRRFHDLLFDRSRLPRPSSA